MYQLGVVYRNIHRADGDLAARLGAFGSATVHEAMGRHEEARQATKRAIQLNPTLSRAQNLGWPCELANSEWGSRMQCSYVRYGDRGRRD